MTVWTAVLLGLVHGIAEFFPISGSGHRAIIYNLFKLSDLTEGHMLFDALLRLAALIALLISLCAAAEGEISGGQARVHDPARHDPAFLRPALP